MHKLLMV